MESLKIYDYMNQYPVTFTETMSVEEAALSFLKTKQMGGPVINESAKVVGFISEEDVLKKMLETLYFNEHIASVKDIMHKDVLSVRPYDSIIGLGQIMVKNKPKLYPVIDDDGSLLGIISRNEVLKACYKYSTQRTLIEKNHAAI